MNLLPSMKKNDYYKFFMNKNCKLVFAQIFQSKKKCSFFVKGKLNFNTKDVLKCKIPKKNRF